eukprot:4531378-Pyramimonas_sp.AAC.2
MGHSATENCTDRYSCRGTWIVERSKLLASNMPDDWQEESWPVALHVYDLSNGMARMMSRPLLGKQVRPVLTAGCQGARSQIHNESQDKSHGHTPKDFRNTGFGGDTKFKLRNVLNIRAEIRNKVDGVWHTGLVVYGKEYFFGGGILVGHSPLAVMFYEVDHPRECGLQLRYRKTIMLLCESAGSPG